MYGLKGRVFCPLLTAAVIALTPGVAPAAGSERVATVMTYNVENLFDTSDNPLNEGDNTYLPRSLKGTPEHIALCERTGGTPFQQRECRELDWSEEVLAAKVRNLAAVILGFNGGQGPDILMLQEVENQAVLDRLRGALGGAHVYPTLVNTESSPGRGINVALLSKLPLVGPAVSHPVPFEGDDQSACGATRDILEVSLTLNDRATLTLFGVHFPSGANPTRCRMLASERLNEVAGGRPESAMLIALGDTNISCSSEDQRVIADVLRERWVVPDEVNKGCRAPGSNFFLPEGQWSFLDLILTGRSLTLSARSGAPWFADFGSFRTVISAPEVQIETDAQGRVRPKRFDAREGSGSSDHWPVAIDLVRRR
ncbi:endonuclease/exonuclease/phosphatase family protein [Roseomonas gilardii]|uniref:endonuclease/exonuclease/phosphatase family protein n=1 Tax=Roseomonas gilardii TaxID=257708 RepID=UPI0011A18A6C|nr:endonuclease/exonuclease/phosphatase family protein [Roseomonas gilardii]